jgi:hypothetical protein
LVAIAVVVFALLNLLARSLAEQEPVSRKCSGRLGQVQREQLVLLQRRQVLQVLFQALKYLEELQVLVLGEFHP